MLWAQESMTLATHLTTLTEIAEDKIIAALGPMLYIDPVSHKHMNVKTLRKRRTVARAALRELKKEITVWAKEAIKQSYNAGIAAANAQVRYYVKPNKLAKTGKIHISAAKILVDKTNERLSTVFAAANHTIQHVYQSVILESAKLKITSGYESWTRTSRIFLNEFTQKGIVGFTDKAGRRWSMSAYTNMLARTVLHEAHNEAQWREFVANGLDLIIVSSHSGACPLCEPWAGKILSLTGLTGGYPTLEAAKGDGLFHPNCLHTTSLYVPDEDKE